MKLKSQVARDLNRDTYLVTFPSDLDADRTLAWLRSISGTLPKRSGGAFSKDTMVFETWATSAGITHRLMTPKSASEYIAAQLRTHGRGVTVTKDDTRQEVNWTAGVSVGMSSPLRQLRIEKHADLAASLLGSVQALQGDEVVLIQWVVSPAPFQAPPSKEVGSMSAEFRVRSALVHGPQQATNDEVNDRRSKLSEQNLLGIGRIMARADNTKCAEELIRRVDSSLGAANSAANYFKTRNPAKRYIGAEKNFNKLKQEANEALSPMMLPAQFSLTELAGVIAWPIGQPFVAGLARGAARQLFATADVATEGRILGDSNFSGHERPIALPYQYATKHMVVTGGAGTGKTAFLANCFAQDVQQGYGAIVIDAGDSESDETMFSSALRYIPKDRIQDLIVVDVVRDRSHPVGFNIFEQSEPRTVADQIVRLFQNLYSDISGVWLPQLLYHGVYTLAEHGGYTFADLVPLLNPQTDEEKAWARSVIDGVKDRDIRDWWKRWAAMDVTKQGQRLEPLYNRIWQLTSRPEILNIIGQSKSTFNIKDVLAENKILLINLAGLSEDTAKILGTLFTNAVWTAARRTKPNKPNFLYLDEFQVMTSNLPIPLDDLLSRSRKHNLGIAMATQHFQNRIPADVRSSAINNARTKVVFRVSNEEARTWNAEFDKNIENQDFRNLNDFEALVRIASDSGVTDVTLHTRPPMKAYGTEHAARELSRSTYGRPVAQIAEERDQRNRLSDDQKPVKKKRPNVGVREWGR